MAVSFYPQQHEPVIAGQPFSLSSCVYFATIPPTVYRVFEKFDKRQAALVIIFKERNDCWVNCWQWTTKHVAYWKWRRLPETTAHGRGPWESSQQWRRKRIHQFTQQENYPNVVNVTNKKSRAQLRLSKLLPRSFFDRLSRGTHTALDRRIKTNEEKEVAREYKAATWLE